LKGFRSRFIVKFKGGLEDVITDDDYCSDNIGLDRSFLTDEHIKALDKVASNPLSIIESVSMEINSVYMIKGSGYSTSATPNRVYFPMHYKHLGEFERLDNSIVYNLKF
jgi:hypothetical protein